MSPARKPYPTDVSDDEWAFVAPYLTLMTEQALQRKHDLREVFNGVRWLVRTGAPWRMLPHTSRPGKRSTSKPNAGCGRRFEAMVHDLRLLAAGAGRNAQPSAVILDGRTLQSTPESGPVPAMTGTNAARAPKCHWRSIPWASVGGCGDAGQRAGAGAGGGPGRAGAGGDGRERGTGVCRPGLHRRGAGDAAAAQGIQLEVVKLPEAQAAASCCCRGAGWSNAVCLGGAVPALGKDYERLPPTVAGLSFLAFTC